jgi:hypothetical protein
MTLASIEAAILQSYEISPGLQNAASILGSHSKKIGQLGHWNSIERSKKTGSVKSTVSNGKKVGGAFRYNNSTTDNFTELV